MLRSAWNIARFGSLLYVVNTYGFEVTMCVGPSMLPTFSTAGDIVLVEKVTPLLQRVARDDVVIAVSPTNPRQTVCKRVRGLAGDEITVRRRSQYDQDRKVVVPEGRVWLEGDNPSNSTDSRSYGPVPYAMLKGRVLFKVWPPLEAGLVR
jgi:inner membrane protease subunit 1